MKWQLRLPRCLPGSSVVANLIVPKISEISVEAIKAEVVIIKAINEIMITVVIRTETRATKIAIKAMEVNTEGIMEPAAGEDEIDIGVCKALGGNGILNVLFVVCKEFLKKSMHMLWSFICL